MPNLGDRLIDTADKVEEIDDEVDALGELLATQLLLLANNQQKILDAIAAIPGAGDLTELQNDVQALVDALVPTEEPPVA